MAVASATNAAFDSGIFFGGIQLLVGAGAPTRIAPKGSFYLNTTGSSTATRMYINTDGAGTWTAVTTVA